MRYDTILQLIDQHKPQTIVETGTWKGRNAIRMLQTARRHHDNPMYVGYDLFEEANEKTDVEEFNIKPHFSMETVKGDIHKSCPFAEVALVKGNTRETLTSIAADFAFIDGGHSLETIQHDYEALKDSKVIVLDDYYLPDEDGKCPDITLVGCNKLVDSLPQDRVTIYHGNDRVKTGGMIALAVVQ